MTGRSSIGRLLLKRWARRLIVSSSGLARIGRRETLKSGLRILTYHRIAEVHGDPFAVSPASFARQMNLLSRMTPLQPLDVALDELGKGEDLKPSMVLTFDDGTADFLFHALPVLVPLQIPATLYISPARVGEPGYMTWQDLAQIVKAGFTVGSHGWDHQSLARLNTDEAEQQIIRSRRELQDRLGIPIQSLAFPYGTMRDFNQAIKEMIRRAGYRAALTSVNGINRSSTDLFELRRTKIEQGDDHIFHGILYGDLDGWGFIDRHLSILQNRYMVDGRD